MKKLLLVSAAIAISAGSFAQVKVQNTISPIKNYTTERMFSIGDLTEETANKSTGQTDSFFYQLSTNDALHLYGDSLTVYSFVGDSGYVFGTNALGFNAFGEYFGVFQAADTSVQIEGALTLFFGHVQPSSTKTINFKVWNVDPITETQVSTKKFLIETPGTVLYNQLASIQDIGLEIDTPSLKVTMFTLPAVTDSSFFLGYDIVYQWNLLLGDTIGLASTSDGNGWGHGQGFVETGTLDTMLYSQTVMRDGLTWKEGFWNYGLDANMSITPLVRFTGGNVYPASVANVQSKDLTMYAAYPNPANNEINIKYALKATSDVTIQIADMTGRIVSTITENAQGKGEHTTSVNTSNLASGNYIYLIRTANGGSLASRFTVAK